MHKIVNGKTVDLTPGEESALLTKWAQVDKDNQEDLDKNGYKYRRKEKYNVRGCTIEAISVAIWEQIIENRPESAAALEVIRSQIKQEEPKPS